MLRPSRASRRSVASPARSGPRWSPRASPAPRSPSSSPFARLSPPPAPPIDVDMLDAVAADSDDADPPLLPEAPLPLFLPSPSARGESPSPPPSFPRGRAVPRRFPSPPPIAVLSPAPSPSPAPIPLHVASPVSSFTLLARPLPPPLLLLVLPQDSSTSLRRLQRAHLRGRTVSDTGPSCTVRARRARNAPGAITFVAATGTLAMANGPPRLRYIGLHADVSPEVAARYDHTPRIPRSTTVEGNPPADLLASYAPPPARSPSPVAGPSRSVRRRVQDLAGGLDAVERFVLRPGLLGAPNDARDV
ncbi:uncharacterized protein B0H18DRAFT_1132309 [Fomitopsis serialis]|uniref:uncharacterized protein n=1 Tax=Fomitopsis serialis TaxID=139415 RepID=UPI0020084493|nr:uncharacterized protein B0H18DRAFT_1132309 [Neoantrodia serialis]KAH9904247.1 hypothetical protein B0H18DRAFT_1132309 [Neoantrodia serialis]